MKISPQESFVLNGGDKLFANRQRELFDQLSIAEKNYNRNQKSPSPPEIDRNRLSRNLPIARRNRNETRNFQGKESLFKRPDLPAPKTRYRSIPDYHRNPHKWVKYDLDDVKNKDMSDKSNTQAALSFLHELTERKKRESEKINKHDKMDIEEKNINCPSTSSRISFKKPSRNIHKNDTIIIDNDDKPVFRNSKIILPEYVVGQKKQLKKPKKDKKIIKIDKTKELKLDHLDHLDDED